MAAHLARRALPGRVVASPSAPSVHRSPRRVHTAVSRDVESALAQANALFGAVSGGAAAQAPPGVQESIVGLEALGYVCDESGCVLVLPPESEADEQPMTLNTCLEGSGWRLGVRDKSEVTVDEVDFPAVAAGDGWSFPLSEGELSDVLAVLQQLRAAAAGLQAQGQWLPAAGDRPASRAKHQSHHIIMQAAWAPPAGPQPAFSAELSVRVGGRRSVTASWPPAAVREICAAVDGLSANGAAAGAGARAQARA